MVMEGRGLARNKDMTFDSWTCLREEHWRRSNLDFFYRFFYVPYKNTVYDNLLVLKFIVGKFYLVDR